jgi:hypothetical protein
MLFCLEQVRLVSVSTIIAARGAPRSGRPSFLVCGARVVSEMGPVCSLPPEQVTDGECRRLRPGPWPEYGWGLENRNETKRKGLCVNCQCLCRTVSRALAELIEWPGVFAQSRPRRRGGALFCGSWAGSGQIRPNPIHHLSFSFCWQLAKIVGNSRKMVKIWNQFC